ncbi:autotransporter assembly complex family protein [Motiliproteus sp. SC1-56]|uniref:autotransporter assembly complex protein TamA n=1 Tax=Motiliproteus sp. SC1-56 TaxID=2799565 RepID=UPI001A8EF948|nr:autotransporter assembly complex family protein [Motiliproteus sp. SC1-56]
MGKPRVFVLLMLLGLWPVAGFAQQSGELKVEILGVNREIRENVRAFLSVSPLAGKAVTSPSRLRYLHAKADQEIRRALQPYGYYRPQISTELEHQDDQWLARYSIDPEEQIPLGEVILEVTGEARTDPAFRALLEESPLVEGAPLEHKVYEGFKRRLQSLAAERGYYRAELVRHRVEVDLAAYRARIELQLESGPQFRIGEVRFSETPLDADFIDRYVTFKPGQPVRSRALINLQSALVDTGYFQRVEVSPLWGEAEGQDVPVQVYLEPNKRTQYRLGLGYGTDTGARGKAGMTRRWVNDRGHQLETQLLLSEIRRSLGAEYSIPGERPQRDRWVVRADLEDEFSDSIDAQRQLLGLSWMNKARWHRIYSLEWQRERFVFGDDEQVSEFLIPRVEFSYVSVLNRLQIEDGYRLSVEALGGSDLVLSDTDFTQVRVGAKTVNTLLPRLRFLGRVDFAATASANFDRLPATLRFFAGGDNSVRGYDYQSLSPRDSDGERIGAPHQLVYSAELDYQFRESWALAAFVDQGDAFTGTEIELNTGAGVGLRWFSPVGPVRLDLAWPLDSEASGMRIHFSLGPDL